jgi:hypothetical protein
MATPASTPAHWDERYRTVGVDQVSWHQVRPEPSLRLITSLNVEPDAPIIDIGGGASTLVDFLVADGRTDITVVDLSATALTEARARVSSETVTWIEADIRTWRPARAYRIWHDRAAYHFLTEPVDQQHYWSAVREHVPVGGWVVIGTFAEDGPESCSGLPVQRYSLETLTAAMGAGFTVSAHERDVHITPSGAEQPFTWVVATRT